MKISELQKFLEEQKKIHGDVEIYEEENDGRTTYSVPFSPKQIVKRVIWKGHPDPARYYFQGY